MKSIKLLLIGLLTVTQVLGVTFDPRPTRDIIIDIDTTVTACFCPLVTEFQSTFTVLAPLIGQIESAFCNFTPIRQSQIGTTGFTITNSGVYKLIEDVIFNPTGSAAAITINTDNVLLDLQCFSISQGNLTSNVDGISVSTNHKNIIIVNGSIRNFTRDGIRIASGCSNLNFLDITLENCLRGMAGIGTIGSPIEIMRLVGLDFLLNTTGLSFTFVEKAYMNDCSYISNDRAGIEFTNSYSNSIDTCLINNINAVNGSVFGITLTGGGDNRIENCTINGISTNDTSMSQVAAGIFVGSNENSDYIVNNIISNVSTTSNALPFGINITYTTEFLITITTPQFADSGVAVNWTPDGRYLALSGATNFGIYEFRNNNLEQVAAIGAGGSTNNSNSWSPDGKFIVNSESNNNRFSVYSFSGSGLVLITSVIISTGLVGSVDWSNNGRYISVTTGTAIRIFEFTGTALVEVSDFQVSNPGIALWSPNDTLLLAGNSTTNSVTVYQFSNVRVITPIATFNLPAGETLTSFQWGQGRYIAVGSSTSPTGIVRVLQFNGSSLSQVAQIATDVVSGLNWSPDGRYITYNTVIAGPNTRFMNVALFTGNSLSLQARINYGTSGQPGGTPRWNPLGSVIALAFRTTSGVGVPATVFIFSALQFPDNIGVINNEISGVQGPALPTGPQPGSSSGRGFSVSSSSNLVIGNTGYDNDVNYVFANNIFQQYLNNVQFTRPTQISNVSFPPL